MATDSANLSTVAAASSEPVCFGCDDSATKLAVHCHAMSLKASGLSSYSGSVNTWKELPIERYG